MVSLTLLGDEQQPAEADYQSEFEDDADQDRWTGRADVERAWLETSQRRYRELVEGKVDLSLAHWCLVGCANAWANEYEFHPEAEQELIEAATRYESEVPTLGFDAPMKSNALADC